MKVFVNRKEVTVSVPSPTVADLLKQQGIAFERGVAVAVNSKVVKREMLHSHPLQPNDSILIIKASQGG